MAGLYRNDVESDSLGEGDEMIEEAIIKSIIILRKGEKKC